MSKKNNYHISIILLHWIMALAIFLMLISGTIIEYTDINKSLKFDLYQYHKSLGVLLLIALLIRVFCRILTVIPTLPKKFSNLEVKLTKCGHYILYFLMLTMVSSGWFIVSTSSYGLPTIVFGLFEWPHIPNLMGERKLHKLAELIHFVGAISLFLAIIGHVGMVIKHKIINKEDLLQRIWFNKRK
ncbi:MAG: cytochrome b561 [Rickettsiales bacterium]|jgi:cytochrome b561